MPRPANLKTRIFLDGGDPAETRETLRLLGFLDGQTTNPTLIAKSPGARARLEQGKKFGRDEVYGYYRRIIGEIAALVPDGSVSVEVYADASTTKEAMFAEAEASWSWAPNLHTKFPTTPDGLWCARRAVDAGMRVNMTLCFSQRQAAAVHAATRGAAKGSVFVSPFIGRLDDIGQDGMSLVANIVRMYKEQGSHVETLAASVRSLDHLLASIVAQADIVTAPFAVLADWARAEMPVPEAGFSASPSGLASIPYEELDLSRQVDAFDASHPLTDKGVEKFAADWNAIIAS